MLADATQLRQLLENGGQVLVRDSRAATALLVLREGEGFEEIFIVDGLRYG